MMERQSFVYIEYDGKSYWFKNTNEREDMFMDKCWYIVKNIDKPNIQCLADIWVNKKYLDVCYPKEIETQLQMNKCI
jgi:hypothetical protein